MKRRVLVVEDDASLARVLFDNLVYEGFDVALADDQLVLGSLRIDFNRCTAERDKQSVPFSQREIEVLRYMNARAGEIVSRDELLRNVWGYQNIPLTRSVDNLIARLRSKVESDP